MFLLLLLLFFGGGEFLLEDVKQRRSLTVRQVPVGLEIDGGAMHFRVQISLDVDCNPVYWFSNAADHIVVKQLRVCNICKSAIFSILPQNNDSLRQMEFPLLNEQTLLMTTNAKLVWDVPSTAVVFRDFGRSSFRSFANKW